VINNKTVLAIIPSRGGSKGVPRKNIREVAGKPLIAWTILESRKSQYIDRLIISTDDKEIADVAQQWGCEVPFLRPAHLALDDTPGVEPVIHAVESLPGYDYVVLLQPTSPLRTVEDIDGCIELCVNKNADSCVSITETDKSPYWMFTLNDEGKMSRLIDNNTNCTRRQDLPPVYALNGAVYVAATKILAEKRSFIHADTVSFIMSKHNSVDIDTELDLTIADIFLKRINNL